MRNGPLQEKLVHLNFAYDLQSTSICAIFCASTGAVLVNVHYTICGAVVGVDFVGSVVGAGKAKGKPTQKIHRQTIPDLFSIATGYTDNVFINRGYV